MLEKLRRPPGDQCRRPRRPWRSGMPHSWALHGARGTVHIAQCTRHGSRWCLGKVHGRRTCPSYQTASSRLPPGTDTRRQLCLVCLSAAWRQRAGWLAGARVAVVHPFQHAVVLIEFLFLYCFPSRAECNSGSPLHFTCCPARPGSVAPYSTK